MTYVTSVRISLSLSGHLCLVQGKVRLYAAHEEDFDRGGGLILAFASQ